MSNNKSDDLLSKVISLCKRRGFVFQSSEIYGGLASCWDYGPLGVDLKNNLARWWWHDMTILNDNIVGLDSSILMHPRVWEASGHLAEFADPMVDCRSCKRRFKADDLVPDIPPEGADWDHKHLEKFPWASLQCPVCGTKGTLTKPRMFHLMFKTHLGPAEDTASTIYLRPETAQGIYVDYQLVMNSARQKVPFGIAQIGKAFRNEITPKNFIFRTVEFEQMEMQFFVKPGTDHEWLETWKQRRMAFYHNLGINPDHVRFHQHAPDELAHYAKDAWDIQYQFPFGWQEFEGIHNRTDFDLKRHAEFSGKDMQYFDEETREHFLPYVIETSAGLNRMMLVVLLDAYWFDAANERVVLRLHPRLAPIKVVICPLVKKDGLPEIARRIEQELRPLWKVQYEQQGAIGRRYYRHDEAGTPYGITVDYDTKEEAEKAGDVMQGTVTLRERDTQDQIRLKIGELRGKLMESLGAQ